MSHKILVIADHHDGQLLDSTGRAVTCAADIGGTIDVLVLAADGQAIADDAATLSGISAVHLIAHEANAHPMAAMLAPQIVAFATAGGYSHVLGPNTTFGKDLMPRVAGLADVAMITDVMKVHSGHEFDRPIYAGNAIVTVRAPADDLLVASIRCASYAAAAKTGNGVTVAAATTDADLPTHTRFVALQQAKNDRPDLQTAAKVISGGRGVGSEENFRIVYDFADKIGAAVGASRAAVDAGYVPNDMQVGQTGKIISPELYMCFGISGAIQHLAGIKDAGTIVAINKDPEAPIFELADIGLVGDLFEIIPALDAAVS